MMNILRFKSHVALFLAALIFLSSCASSTKIESIPPGAKLFIDGEPVGVTPYIHKDLKIISSSTNIRMEKEGFNPFYIDISKDEEINLVPAVAGFFFLVPWLWAFKYKSVHVWQLNPVQPAEPSNTEVRSGANDIGPNQKKDTESTTSGNKYDELRALKKLLDEGVLTQEEFDVEKQKILDSPE